MICNENFKSKVWLVCQFLWYSKGNNILYPFLQNQLFGKGKDTIYDAGARIKRALSPGRNIDPDLFDVSPYGSPTRSPKVPRLSLNPEISDDEDDDDVGNDGDKETASAAVY